MVLKPFYWGQDVYGKLGARELEAVEIVESMRGVLDVGGKGSDKMGQIGVID